MRMKIMYVLRVGVWWMQAFFKVQLPMGALLGLRTH
jgi:hypothetical protein